MSTHEETNELNGHEDNGTTTDVPTAAAGNDDEKSTLECGSPEGMSRVGEGDHDDDDDESDEEDEDEDEDEEEEDDEPALKYERIGGSIPDLLKKDSASALAISPNILALGTHAGIVHILTLSGKRIKSYKPHLASIIDITLDTTGEFIGTASLDGQIVIHALSTPSSSQSHSIPIPLISGGGGNAESYMFDMKRPMRCIALEPEFGRKSTRAFVSGGMAGHLVLREKGWVGHKETTLHSGEGPIWTVKWRDRLIAWANDLGVKIYDTHSQSRITFIDRPASSPRADLFKCTLHWQDDSTLLIAWADHIKVARIRARPKLPGTGTSTTSLPPLLVEITAIFQLDGMIAGIAPHPTPHSSSRPGSISTAASRTNTSTPSLHHAQSQPTSLLTLTYTPPDTSFLQIDSLPSSRAQEARKPADRPELRIISRTGEELAEDALTVTGYEKYTCNDYSLVQIPDATSYVVLSPRDIVLVRPRDQRDHVAWLVQRKRYEEALAEIEILETQGVKVSSAELGVDAPGRDLTSSEIGGMYVEWLVGEREYDKAARLCPKVCAGDAKKWESWIFVFAEARELQTIIPHVPTESPRLDHLVYEMMLAYFLTNDRQALYRTISSWPKGIYDISAVILAVHGELDRITSSVGSLGAVTNPPPINDDERILMECLAELYTSNRQPGKALPYFLRLRRPNVLDLIRDNNLFTDVQDQVLLLVEFDQERIEDGRKGDGEIQRSEALMLLVDHVHSIPMGRVVQQLRPKPYYLFLYLDALFAKDPHLASGFADLQVELYAEFATLRLIEFLRASTYYTLEKAYNICKQRDLVPEMVFLLGRMGNNKEALTVIIERLGDVNRAIDFAKEQADDDLWEDLLKYSETRPKFIQGLLLNVGAEIDPIRLIRRIKLGLEIPGLKEALIKILQDFHLQISLLEGCQRILGGDCMELAKVLKGGQMGGFGLGAKSKCPICTLPLNEGPQSVLLLFLCRHVVHARCVAEGEQIMESVASAQADLRFKDVTRDRVTESNLSAKIAFSSLVRAKVRKGCPVCVKRAEGQRT